VTKLEWFTVRCIFRFSPSTYEERITLWQASDIDAALQLAEREAITYVDEGGAEEYLGTAQAYRIGDKPEDSAEVFSLLRHSSLSANEYIENFFSTGDEHTA